MARSILWLVIAAFGAFSAYVLQAVGLVGLFVNNLSHPAGQQVFIDLLIALGLVMVWMWQDARKTGRNVWPWIVATLLIGSFAPLAYLVTRKDAP